MSPARPPLSFHFVGVSVAAFEPALRFYRDAFGFAVRERKQAWAYLESAGLVFELFGDAEPEPGVAPGWGRRQALRVRLELPGDDAADRLAREGAELERDAGGRMVGLRDPAGIDWSLGTAAVPRLASADLKVADVAGQIAFYTDVMGLRVERAGAVAELAQERHPARLRLHPGGRALPGSALRADDPRSGQPVVATFETPDIDAAIAWLEGRGARFLQGRTVKPWGGIDAYVLDADGHPLQVVQYIGG